MPGYVCTNTYMKKRMETRAPTGTAYIHIYAVHSPVHVRGVTTSKCNPTTDTNGRADGAGADADGACRAHVHMHLFL